MRPCPHVIRAITYREAFFHSSVNKPETIAAMIVKIGKSLARFCSSCAINPVSLQMESGLLGYAVFAFPCLLGCGLFSHAS